jgi:hypothetical protein
MSVAYGTAVLPFHVSRNPSLVLTPIFVRCLCLIPPSMSLLTELTNGLESLTHHFPDWDFLVRPVLHERSRVLTSVAGHSSQYSAGFPIHPGENS